MSALDRVADARHLPSGQGGSRHAHVKGPLKTGA